LDLASNFEKNDLQALTHNILLRSYISQGIQTIDCLAVAAFPKGDASKCSYPTV